MRSTAVPDVENERRLSRDDLSTNRPSEPKKDTANNGDGNPEHPKRYTYYRSKQGGDHDGANGPSQCAPSGEVPNVGVGKCP